MASFEPFVSSDPFSMSTFNTKLGGAFGKVDKNVSDAQAVANNALQVAQTAGVKITEVFNRNLEEMNSGTYQFSKSIEGCKILIFEVCDDITNSTGANGRGYCVIPYPCNTPAYIMPAGFSSRTRSYVRPITAITDTSFSVGDARSGASSTSSDWAVITKVYAVR